MDKLLTFYDLPDIDALPRLERWLYRDAAPAVLSAQGPLLTRYETYRSIYMPSYVQDAIPRYGTYSWRMVESCCLETPLSDDGLDHGGALVVPQPPQGGSIALS